jgi:hypothetical protein
VKIYRVTYASENGNLKEEVCLSGERWNQTAIIATHAPTATKTGDVLTDSAKNAKTTAGNVMPPTAEPLNLLTGQKSNPLSSPGKKPSQSVRDEKEGIA